MAESLSQFNFEALRLEHTNEWRELLQDPDYRAHLDDLVDITIEVILELPEPPQWQRTEIKRRWQRAIEVVGEASATAADELTVDQGLELGLLNTLQIIETGEWDNLQLVIFDMNEGKEKTIDLRDLPLPG